MAVDKKYVVIVAILCSQLLMQYYLVVSSYLVQYFSTKKEFNSNRSIYYSKLIENQKLKERYMRAKKYCYEEGLSNDAALMLMTRLKRSDLIIDALSKCGVRKYYLYARGNWEQFMSFFVACCKTKRLLFDTFLIKKNTEENNVFIYLHIEQL